MTMLSYQLKLNKALKLRKAIDDKIIFLKSIPFNNQNKTSMLKRAIARREIIDDMISFYRISNVLDCHRRINYTKQYRLNHHKGVEQ